MSNINTVNHVREISLNKQLYTELKHLILPHEAAKNRPSKLVLYIWWESCINRILIEYGHSLLKSIQCQTEVLSLPPKMGIFDLQRHQKKLVRTNGSVDSQGIYKITGYFPASCMDNSSFCFIHINQLTNQKGMLLFRPVQEIISFTP